MYTRSTCRSPSHGQTSNGRSTAEALLRAGAWLVIAARSAPDLEQLAADLRQLGEVVPVACDVTVAGDRGRLIETAVRALGGLDILINNSGVGSFGHFAT